MLERVSQWTDGFRVMVIGFTILVIALSLTLVPGPEKVIWSLIAVAVASAILIGYDRLQS